MPKTSERPAETRKSSPASVSALRSCSARFSTPTDPLREVLGAALRRHLLAGIGRQDLRNRMRILGILDRLDGKAELDGLVVALAHEERALEPLVARVLPGIDHLLHVVGARLLDHLGEPLEPLVRLAVEHVRIHAVQLVEALDEIAV